MKGLWLVRHGALPPNPERRFVGAQDIPMSDAGRAQIINLARELRAEAMPAPMAVVCSDLHRGRETAALLACSADGWNLPVRVDADMREINLGCWQGLTPAEVEQAFPGAYARRGADLAEFCPPNGESFATVQERALAALARARGAHPEGILILAGHAGLNRTLLAQYLALPLGYLLCIPQKYACRVFLPGW